ncbi:MAG: acyclic terpene utilization AtuA family protein [Rhodobacteraceae bacterium]|nr:acyclic terpene utilization AtuA family protein [Paracoccaceae bacterium]
MTRVLIPSGVLGLAYDRNALAAGVATRPDIIAIDGGSTDSGPHYLGTGTSKYSRAAIAAEWRDLLEARSQLDVPLVLGSAGTCGTDSSVDWMVEITDEIARQLGQGLRVATIKSSVEPGSLAQAWETGKISELSDAPLLSTSTLLSMSNAVAVMGVEQIVDALSTGADIVIAGRATDTAPIAALPIERGDCPGASWHAAKVAECGALCSTHPMSGCVVVETDDCGFEIEPMHRQAKCTPETVSAHMLYENADPFRLHEPGGFLDVRDAVYTAKSNRRVRVQGSSWTGSSDYRVKLEGARLAGYQTTILALLRSSHYVQHARAWADRLLDLTRQRIAASMALTDGEYSLEFRLIGIDATLGPLEGNAANPLEVGVLGIVTARTQERSLEIAKLLNPYMLHMPLAADEELPTFAFPYSPAETPRGPLYEFCLNHVLQLDDPMEVFRIDVFQAGVPRV